MARYRGFDHGRQRGRYTQAKVGIDFDEEKHADFWNLHASPYSLTPFAEVAHYLRHAGVYLASFSEQRPPYIYERCLYHYAGASVLLDYSQMRTAHKRSARFEMTIVSNDSIADILERFQEKFPRMKQEFKNIELSD